MSDNKFISISSDCIIDGRYIWLPSIKVNAVFKIDIKSERCLGYIPFPEASKEELTISAESKNGYTYFAPYNAEKIYRLNMELNLFDVIESKELENQSNVNHKFSKIIQDDDNLFLFGQGVKRLYRYNIKTNNLEEIQEYGRLFDKKFDSEWDAYIDDYCIENRIVYIPQKKEKCILLFDINTKTFETIQVKGIKNNINTLNYFQDHFILSDIDGNIYRWNLKNNTTELLRNVGDLLKRIYLCENGDLVCIFAKYRKVIRIDITNNNDINREYDLSGLETNGFPEGIYWQFEFSKQVGDYIYAQLRCDGTIIEIDTKNDACRRIDIEIDDELRDSLVHDLYNNKKEDIYCENFLFRLRDFIVSIHKQDK